MVTRIIIDGHFPPDMLAAVSTDEDMLPGESWAEAMLRAAREGRIAVIRNIASRPRAAKGEQP